MYEYLKGKLVESAPGRITLDIGGVGYSILIPLNNYSKLPQTGSEIFFYILQVIREDAHTLFGFLTRGERELFKKLNDVSGIGPKTALALIGHMEASDLQIAISQGNLSLLCKVPGIGKKTAERLIVDLRDAIKKTSLADIKGASPLTSDALNALVNLGYNPLHAQKAIHEVMKNVQNVDLPKLITEALRCI